MGREPVPAAPPAWDAEVEGTCGLPVVVRALPRWQRTPDGAQVECVFDDGQSWKAEAIVAVVLEGLAAGEPLWRLVRAVHEQRPGKDPRIASRVALGFVAALRRKGCLDIALPPVPEVFDGRYHRLRELGRGGLGVAWLCRDAQAPARPVVVVKHAWNFFQPLRVADRELRAEGDVLRRLDHPAIGRFLGSFEVDGRYHLVRAYLEGRSLETLGSAEMPPEAERRRIVAHIAEAVGHLHARGWLLLDFNPGNFFLQADGRVILGDVGFARPMTEGRAVLERAMGTRGYLAPEVVQTKVATPRSDVCALGRLYYALVLGKRPSQRASAADLAARLQAAGASPFDVGFVAACCADAPEARPRTMAEVVRLLLPDRPAVA